MIISHEDFSFLRSRAIALVIAATLAVTGVLALLPCSVRAAATFVQTASINIDSGAPSIAKSFPRATTAGNTIVAAISWGDVQNVAVTLTDSQKNTYQRAGTGAWDTSNRQGLVIYYATNIKGGADTITARFGTSICCRYLAIHEYAGVSAFDGASYHVDPVGTTQVDGITSGQIVTTAAGDLIFGAMVDDSPWHSSASLAPGTNFAKRDLFAGFMSEDGAQSVAGGISTTFTSNSADSYLTGVAAFKTTTYTTPPPPSSSPPPSDTTPPSVPTNLSASVVSSSQINLSWTASTDNVGVAGYQVFRNGSQIAATSATSYADFGLSPSTTYSYTVAAYDAAGNVSGHSNVASATTAGTQSSTPISCTVQGNFAYDGGSPITLTAPTVGNLIILGMNNNSGDTVKSVSDNKGNAYQWVGIRGSDPASVEEIWYAANASPGVTTVTINLAQSSYDDVNLYDCSGASAAPFDSAAALNGQSNFSTNNGYSGPSVSASTGGGVIIALSAVELGNVSGVSSPFTFDPQLQNNGWAHFFNVSPGTYTPTWGPISQNSYPGTYSGLTAAFKGAQSSTTAAAISPGGFLSVPENAITVSTIIPVNKRQRVTLVAAARSFFLTGQASARGIPPPAFLSRGTGDPLRMALIR